MKLAWLKARQTKYAGYISVYILVVVGDMEKAGIKEMPTGLPKP